MEGIVCRRKKVWTVGTLGLLVEPEQEPMSQFADLVAQRLKLRAATTPQTRLVIAF